MVRSTVRGADARGYTPRAPPDREGLLSGSRHNGDRAEVFGDSVGAVPSTPQEAHRHKACSAPDEEGFAAAVAAAARVVVTENVPDFRRLEAVALADGARCPGLIYTTNRQFPRGDPATAGRMVLALAELLADPATAMRVLFLKPLAE